MPTTADIFLDRVTANYSNAQREDIQKEIQALNGSLYDGSLDPNGNLSKNPLGFFSFPDGSKVGVAGSLDPEDDDPNWDVWVKG